MGRLNDALSEDTNQFGPGTDLTISLLAVLLVMTLITAHLYRLELDRNKAMAAAAAARGGNFRLASDSFAAADFRAYPVTELVDQSGTAHRVTAIVDEYRRLANDYPYIFVIGHSSAMDDRNVTDGSTEARRQRNWVYAARRATMIAGLMQQDFDATELERVVVVTTGELDLKQPRQPLSQENAWVEVVFGKEWSLPGRKGK
jgi:hypothetical protein